MLFARSQQVVLGKEMEVQAMETKTRQDATRGHIRPLALPALKKTSIRIYHIRCRNRRRGRHGQAPFRTLQ